MNELKTSSNIIPFSFIDQKTGHPIRIKESLWINGKPYFTGQAIGEFLEYNYPREAINKIVERNPHITDSAWSVEVKLTSTDGKMYDTRVYDPIALQLIINKSNQPKAIAFQVAVAHLVVAFMTGTLTEFIMCDASISSSRLDNFCNMVTSIASVHDQKKMVLACSKRNMIDVKHVLNLVRQRTGVSIPSPRQARRKFQDEYATAMAYHLEHPLTAGLGIKRALGLTASERTINQWIREQMLSAA